MTDNIPPLTEGMRVALFVIGAVVLLGALGTLTYQLVVLQTEPTTKLLIAHGIFACLGALAMMPNRLLALLEKLPKLKK